MNKIGQNVIVQWNIKHKSQVVYNTTLLLHLINTYLICSNPIPSTCNLNTMYIFIFLITFQFIKLIFSPDINIVLSICC